jgi:hypothetical protein
MYEGGRHFYRMTWHKRSNSEHSSFSAVSHFIFSYATKAVAWRTLVLRRVMLQANEEGYMGLKGIITGIIGVIIGAVVGYLAGQSALGAVIGAGIVAVVLVLIVLIPFEVWVTLAEFGQIAECCLSFVVLLLASTVTLGGLLLWHSLALAALAGVGVMTVLLVVLSAGTRSYKEVLLCSD